MNDEHAEKLYSLNGVKYVQYNGKGKMPSELEAYIKSRGELPPFMPLPTGKVEFRMEYGAVVSWSGKGALPDEVLAFVHQKGNLPRYKSENSGPEEEYNDDWDDQDDRSSDRWAD